MLKRIAKQLLKRHLGVQTADESRRIEAFRQRISALPALDPECTGSEALREWDQNRARLRDLVLTQDPRGFLEWDVIRDTMFVGNSPLVEEELKCLRASSDWRQRWQPALREDAVGLPQRCRYYLQSSGNLIHHAYSLFRFEQAVGRTVDQFPFILEFGGGYGSFCRLAHRVGFRGKYLIFDLPEFSALQEFFLESVGVPLLSRSGHSGVSCISRVDELERCLEGSSEWLLVGLWSLSEAPVSLRETLLGDGSKWGGYLISYQQKFGEVDNSAFFATLQRQQKKFDLITSPIKHLPGNHYLFGAKRNGLLNREFAHIR
jgi:hypothetical protein